MNRKLKFNSGRCIVTSKITSITIDRTVRYSRCRMFDSLSATGAQQP